jgi:hypothetical protein
MRVKSHLTSVDVRKQYTLCFVISISGTEVDSCNELVMNGHTIVLAVIQYYMHALKSNFNVAHIRVSN